MHINVPEQLLWAAGLLGHAILLLVLFGRARAQKFPIFTALIGYNVIESILLFLNSTTGTPHQQYVRYWWIVFVGYAFEIAFIFEVAYRVMCATKVVVKQAMRPFLICSVLSVAVAALASHEMTAGKASGLDLWDMRTTYFATIVTVTLYGSLVSITNMWELPWRSHAMALGQGFSIWLFFSTVMDSLHVWRGWRWSEEVFDEVSKCVYVGVLGYWIVALWFPERELSRPIDADSDRMIRALGAKADKIQMSDQLHDHNSRNHHSDDVVILADRDGAAESYGIVAPELGRSDSQAKAGVD